MSHLTDRQLQTLKQALMDEKQYLNKQADYDSYGLADSLGENTGELSAYDNHPADLATELYDREKDVALNESAEEHSREIDVALEAMDRGEYGICRTCGTEIEFDRLQAVPTTLFCKEHSPSRLTSFRRPVEEKLSQDITGYSNPGLQEVLGNNAFDGEDAWQIVESWGTSNTPAMAEDPNVESYNEMYIEADENDGYVEAFESFLATDMYGKQLTVIRNKQYRQYMDSGQGEGLLDPDEEADL